MGGHEDSPDSLIRKMSDMAMDMAFELFREDEREGVGIPARSFAFAHDIATNAEPCNCSICTLSAVACLSVGADVLARLPVEDRLQFIRDAKVRFDDAVARLSRRGVKLTAEPTSYRLLIDEVARLGTPA